ncbi:hypothetical protein ABID39_001020 [Bartonella japonica]|uniref:Uncharacterized protein n=1 Tax=Bartonella japonica TaxID=357761 RepID=A0ABV2FP27_9HYPH
MITLLYAVLYEEKVRPIYRVQDHFPIIFSIIAVYNDDKVDSTLIDIIHSIKVKLIKIFFVTFMRRMVP